MLPTLPISRPLAAPAPAGVPGGAELAPPLLVGEHFVAALSFLVAGGAGLVLCADHLALGAFYVPRVAAVVHLFTIGWITLSIFGALCQFLPVAVGRPLASYAVAHLSFASLSLGASLMVAGLFVGSRPLLLSGAAGLSLAFLTFGGNLAVTLFGAKERGLTFWALVGATAAIFVTPAYGVALALQVHDGGLADPFATIGRHAHVAIIGFVLMVMVGVAHRLMPMFLLVHGVSARPGWAALGLYFTAAVLLALPWGGDRVALVAGVLALAGVGAMVVQAAAYYRHRTRRAIDPGMTLAAAGLVGLVVAAALAPFALSRGVTAPRLLSAYFTVLLGSISLFIAGHYYKIVPFLVWNHRFGPLLGKVKVPKVAELYSERLARADAALLVLGLVTLALGVALGSVAVTHAGAVAFTAGALLEVVILARVARTKVATSP